MSLYDHSFTVNESIKLCTYYPNELYS